MTASRSNARRRPTRRLLAVVTLALAAAFAASPPASAATTATFSNGVLTVNGDAANNSIALSRNAAGKILVNNGAVAVVGGSPTVANTSLIRVFGLAGNDSINLDETNGALPRANLFGGANNDTLGGGSSADQLFGQGGNDTLQGRGGIDVLTGGNQNDTLTGGTADDQAFGQSGNDRMIWNPGDGTDLNEGGVGTDTVEVNGGGGGEQFATTANGLRVRFDRLNPAPFAIDIGTSERLVLNANGGGDSHSATGNLAALIAITVDGGAGNDTILGSNGIDLLLGGANDDFVDGQQGNDVAFLGDGTDVFQWDPGDGSDTVEGQDGSDTMLFNGSGAAENIDIAANGGRVLFFRNIAAVTMDLDDVETVDFNALGGADLVVVNDLSGTDLSDVNTDLAFNGSGDAQPDNVVVHGTNGDDVALVEGSASGASVLGLAARVDITGAEAANDRLTVNLLAGDDVVDASSLAAGSIQLTADGGGDDDVLIGGDGNDVLLGGAGDDVLIGGPGLDVIDGGDGDDIEIQLVGEDNVTSARSVGRAWVSSHFQVVRGNTVLEVGGETHSLPRLDLNQLT